MQEKRNGANGTYEMDKTLTFLKQRKDLRSLDVIYLLKVMAEYCKPGNTFSVDNYVLRIFHFL